MRRKYVTAKEIAEVVNGFVSGNQDVKLYGISLPRDSKKGMLTFVDNNISNTKRDQIPCSAILTTTSFMLPYNKTYIVTNKDLYMVLHKVVQYMIEKGLYEKERVIPKFGENISIGKNVVIEEAVEIGDHTILYSNVYIGENTKIGNNCVIYPNVTIVGNVTIGDHVVIQAGSVIGGSSFEYGESQDGYVRIPNLGKVIIENHVRIGSNVTIDRGTIGHTWIGEGTIIDNLVQIGHEVITGKRCKICSQCALAGWSTLKDGVILYGKVGVNNHVTIGEDTIVLGMSGVTKNIQGNKVVSGNPAQENHLYLREKAIIRKMVRERRSRYD